MVSENFICAIILEFVQTQNARRRVARNNRRRAYLLQLFTNASRSELMTSAWVVAMPCG